MLTLASVFSLSLTFLAGLLFVVTFFGSNQIVKFFESKAQISAYFKEEATEQDIIVAQNQLEQTGLTKEIEYISKSEARAIFDLQAKDYPEILETLDSKESNPFPASLEIEAKEVADLEKIANLLKSNGLIEEIAFRKDIIDTLRSWTLGLRVSTISLTAMFGIISALVVLITIGLTILSKKNEIEIMRLLGADKGYIRGPFILQGSFYGLTGSFLSIFYFVGVAYLATPYLRNLLSGIPLPHLAWYILVSAGLVWILLGAFLGALVSIVAIGRYIKK